MRIIDQNLFNSMRLEANLGRMLKYNPDILCLQEFKKEKFDKINKSKLSGYHLIYPHKTGHKTNCFISKIIPIKFGEIHLSSKGDVVELVNPKKHDTLAFWADFQIGKDQVRIYNCHFEVEQIGFGERIKMLKNIIKHSKNENKVMIIGDMNTTIPCGKFNRFLNFIINKSRFPKYNEYGDFSNKSEKFYFKHFAESEGFKELLDFNHNTWRFPFTSFEICNLKLDWVLCKNVEGSANFEYKTLRYLDHKTIIIDL